MISESGGWEKTFGGIEDLAWADDEIRKFLYYFERSSIMRNHILLQFKTKLINDRDLVETDIGEDNESNTDDQKAPD